MPPTDDELDGAARARDERTKQWHVEESPIVLPDDPDFGPEVQVDYPGYRSTRWRAPDRPLVTIPEEFHDLEGPVFGPTRSASSTTT